MGPWDTVAYQLRPGATLSCSLAFEIERLQPYPKSPEDALSRVS